MISSAAIQAGTFGPYDRALIGFEAVYTGQTTSEAIDASDAHLTRSTDAQGQVIERYSLWGCFHTSEADWNDEIRAINHMQAQLGPLDDEARAIRAHIASLVPCDSGFPVTVDEALNAIGTGHLPQPAFHPGCWMSRGTRSTQPYQAHSMRVIESVLRSYLANQSQEALISEHPFARGFIERSFAWLGPREALSEVQQLMLERILLPFAFFAKHEEDRQAVFENCFLEGGSGKALDARISTLAGIPEIHPNYRQEFRDNLAAVTDPQKRTLYLICGHIADCVSELSDCHHSTFRRVERWIHGVGRLSWDIPTRQASAEGIRLGRLLFGYALALDRWLQEVPMHFLLLDLGHLDLGFDPKNEILRTYAYLGESYTPVKKWLAACLWYTLALMPPASLYKWGWRHKELLVQASGKGINVREWMHRHLDQTTSAP